MSADFAARFPEISGTDQALYLPAVEEAWPAYYGLPYSADTKECILNLCAHLLTIDARADAAASNAEQSKSVGSVSVSYGGTMTRSERANFYASTKYGQRFLILSGQRAGGVFA